MTLDAFDEIIKANLDGEDMTRGQLFDAISRLLPAQFDVLVNKLGAPKRFLSGAQTPMAARASEILQWAEQREGIADLERMVKEVVKHDVKHRLTAALREKAELEVVRIVASATVKCVLVGAIFGIGGELLKAIDPLTQQITWVLASILSIYLTHSALANWVNASANRLSPSVSAEVLSIKKSVAIVIPVFMGIVSVGSSKCAGRAASHWHDKDANEWTSVVALSKPSREPMGPISTAAELHLSPVDPYEPKPMPETPAAPTASVASPTRMDYRGILRDMSTGQPVQGAWVALIGTSCEVRTGLSGDFDFSNCGSGVVSRLRNPRIGISRSRGNFWECQDIPLKKPPLMTEVRIDWKNCLARRRVLGFE